MNRGYEIVVLEGATVFVQFVLGAYFMVWVLGGLLLRGVACIAAGDFLNTCVAPAAHTVLVRRGRVGR